MTAAMPAAETAPVRVADLAPEIRVSLRCAPEARTAAEAALGLALPDRIGARATAGGRAALCLGPDEWTLTAAEDDRAALLDALAAASSAAALSAVDISDREISLAIEGPAALDLLATGCPLDLARLPVGNGVRTIFDSVQVVLVREADARFRLTVWRSFAPHVRALLDAATQELAIGI